jgi:FkbM family methyltransferase
MSFRALIKGGIRHGLGAAGYSVARVVPTSHAPAGHKFSPDTQDKFNWLKRAGINTVLDIGANEGQFAAQIRLLLPDAFIHSFEPVSDCHRKLSERMYDDARFAVLPIALGDENAETIIYQNDFSQASSLLPTSALVQEAYPFAARTAAHNISVSRLDDVARGLSLRDNILIKIDVQGFEDRVIRGGPLTIKRATVVILEVSFEILYEGQWLFADIYDAMRDLGFSYFGSLDQNLHPSDGRVLQANAIFMRG